MNKIAVDTSFLIFMVKRKVDINRINELFSGPVELYTSEGVINELNNIINSEKRDASYAKLSFSLLKKLNLQIINNKDTPDDWLITQQIIATVDLPLSKKALEKGVRVINITKSNKLVLR
jgi:rRNA-processing protein FCF1